MGYRSCASLSCLVLCLLFVSCLSEQRQPPPYMENVAVHRRCKQSSVYKNRYIPAGNNCTAAINNDTDGVFTRGNCVHTWYGDDPRSGPFWEVLLDEPVDIQQISVYPRTDGEQNWKRMAHVVVDVDNETVNEFGGDLLPRWAEVTVITQNLPLTGQTVKLHKNGQGVDVFLNICEVQVWACLRDRHGDNCSRTCSDGCVDVALGNRICNSTSGHCLQGCKPGKHGKTCSENCGHCLNGTGCDIANGRCPKGCQPGWKKPMCTECVPGKHGDNCSKECGHCLDGKASCNTTTGYCPRGKCKTGWKGPMCTECVPGKHGKMCKKDCGHCLDGKASCNTTTGFCPGGECKTEWKGPMCKGCAIGFYPRNNSEGQGECVKCGDGCQRSKCLGPDGHCDCKPGWMPPSCEEKCTNRTWGQNCTQSCGQCNVSADCMPENGTCPFGCVEGFHEPLCTETREWRWADSLLVITLVAVGVAVGVSVAAVVVGIRRERCKPSRKRRHDATCTAVTLAIRHGSETSDRGPAMQQQQQQPTSSDHNQPTMAASPCPHPTDHADYVNIQIPRQGQSTSLAADADIPLYENYPCSGAEGTTSTWPGPKRPEKQGARAMMTVGDKGAEEEEEFRYMLMGCPGLMKTLLEPSLEKRKKAEDRSCEKTTMATTMGLVEEEEDVYIRSDLYALFSAAQGHQSLLDSFQTRLLHCLAHPEELSEQFKKLSMEMQYPTEARTLPAIASKNHFKKVGAYDKNCVLLNRPAMGDDTDYLNVSFIKGAHSARDYIAVQDPHPKIVGDLWWMVWQEEVEQIVMFTSLVEHDKNKCAEYWPPLGETVAYGQITVTSQRMEEKTDFNVRTFSISLEGNDAERRTVHQYHYLAWPDRGLPVATSFVRFWRYVTAHVITPYAPTLVLCSGDVGRTGTYIALDMACKRKSYGLDVNIHSIVMELREQGSIMVRSEAQYTFLHEVVLEEHTSCGTVLTLGQLDQHFPDPVYVTAPHPAIDPQFQILKLLKTLAKRNTSVALMEENKDKNRDLSILPDNNQLNYLDVYCNGRKQYFNAVFLSSLLVRRGVLLTQLPLPDTVVDLWRLVDAHHVHLIVSLGDHHPSDVQNYTSYWPQSRCQTMKAGSHTVQLEKVSQVSETITLYHLHVDAKEERRSVKVLHYTDWIAELPSCSSDVLHLINLLKQEAKQVASPVIVQCLDGATQSGLFYVLCDLVSCMTEDKEVDVFSTVRYLHQVRPQALTTEMQYRYCYRVAQAYRDSQMRQQYRK
ncbi:uncharacterized protein LOC143299877 [Babylonia areolata]|uniref:uncharacterized protein LOC143299877 n=1 Tax=Babylonia areolata TaxID=304850 RepID=UPI003FD16CFC